MMFRAPRIRIGSMASKDAEKDKVKQKAKPKPQAKGDPKDKEKAAKAAEKDKAKAAKAKEGADAAAKEPKEEKPKAPPRPPADPRLKFLKKFHGKFLPRGPLRDRHRALMDRWNSGEDHGGVTAEELKSLYNDWKASREKPARKKAASV
jgi:hypothetical protein